MPKKKVETNEFEVALAEAARWEKLSYQVQQLHHDVRDANQEAALARHKLIGGIRGACVAFHQGQLELDESQLIQLTLLGKLFDEESVSLLNTAA